MSLSTYSDLQAAVASWLARDDLTSVIPDLITLFEAAACRRLHVRPMETTATLSPTAGVVALPSGFLGARRLTRSGSPDLELTYVHPSMFGIAYPSTDSGVGRAYTIEAGNIKIRPSDDTSLSLLYLARTAAVSGTLNWLFTTHPDAYLFGTLCEAEAYNKDAEKAALWKARRDEVFDEIAMVDFRERPTMQVRTDGYTP